MESPELIPRPVDAFGRPRVQSEKTFVAPKRKQSFRLEGGYLENQHTHRCWPGMPARGAVRDAKRALVTVLLALAAAYSVRVLLTRDSPDEEVARVYRRAEARAGHAARQ